MDAPLSAGHDTPDKRRRRRGVWVWLGICVLFTAIGLTVAADLMLRRAGPILKGRVLETLRVRFNSQVELDTFHVSVVHGLSVSGSGLRIYPPDDIRAAGDNAPLIAIRDFTFHAALRGLFLRPTHVGTIHVTGLTLTIPPRQLRKPGAGRTERGKIKVVVNLLVIDDSRLVLQTMDPNKDPKVFTLRRITLHDFGPRRAMQYDALLDNAIPPGDIHATGTFGPWNVESPGDSPVDGNYVFANANLASIHGISGMLHSTGRFHGQLNRIEVWGVTDTPDFALDTANRPMPLHTDFHAIVDGTNGDTYLMPVQATLAQSSFTCQGSVVTLRGKGHNISLDVSVPDGRIEDFLALAARSKPFMTGRLKMRARLDIPPGAVSISHKLELRSQFELRQIHFTNPDTEDRVDELSLRARGQPDLAHPGATDVHSTMAGDFVLRSGVMDFSRLVYTMPGGEVQLAGHYSLAGERFAFAGDVRTSARMSQMVSTWWKRLLLKPVDPFFAKDGSGAVIPIRVSGTKDKPQFALDFGHHKSRR